MIESLTLDRSEEAIEEAIRLLFSFCVDFLEKLGKPLKNGVSSL